jgi:cyclic pyranopterin phosphate synthase
MQNQLPVAPAEGPLLDTFGRIADDLRISVTDRCNFRCTYCMPAEGLQWLPKDELLTFEELTGLLALFVRPRRFAASDHRAANPTIRPTCRRSPGWFRQAGPDLDISITTKGCCSTGSPHRWLRPAVRPRDGLLRLAPAGTASPR